MVIIVFGLPGSGKSYFAARLADKLGAIYVNSDELRLGLFQERTYSDKEKLAVYDMMLNKMTAAVSDKKSIVLDATFYKASIRKEFESKASELGEQIIYIEITAPEDLIKERVSQQRKASEADYSVYLKLKKNTDPLSEDHLVLRSSNNNIVKMLNDAIKYVKNRS